MRDAREDREVTKLLGRFERTVARLAELGVDPLKARPEVLNEASMKVTIDRASERRTA